MYRLCTSAACVNVFSVTCAACVDMYSDVYGSYLSDISSRGCISQVDGHLLLSIHVIPGRDANLS